MSELYNRIVSLCEAKNVSITKMCAESGVARSSMTDLKKQRNTGLSSKALSALSRYFGVSVDYLLGNEKSPAREGEDDVKQYLQLLRDRPETRMLLDYSRGVSKEDIEAVAEMIKRFKQND